MARWIHLDIDAFNRGHRIAARKRVHLSRSLCIANVDIHMDVDWTEYWVDYCTSGRSMETTDSSVWIDWYHSTSHIN